VGVRSWILKAMVPLLMLKNIRLLKLLRIHLFNAGPIPTTSSNLIQNTPAANPLDDLISTTSSSTNDIVNLFGSSSTKQIASSQNAQSENSLDILMDLGATKPLTTISSSTETNAPEQFVAYNKNGFKINLSPFKDQNNPNILNINVTFHNVGVGSDVQNLLFQAAVPKTQRLQMQPPSSTTIAPNANVTQTIRVANPQRANVRLKLRIVYDTSAGGKVDDIAEFSGFPQDFW